MMLSFLCLSAAVGKKDVISELVYNVDFLRPGSQLHVCVISCSIVLF